MKKLRGDSLIFVIVSLIILSFVLGGLGYGGYGGMISMLNGDYGNGMMFFGCLYLILILIALVLFIVWLVQKVRNNQEKK